MHLGAQAPHGQQRGCAANELSNRATAEGISRHKLWQPERSPAEQRGSPNVLRPRQGNRLIMVAMPTYRGRMCEIRVRLSPRRGRIGGGCKLRLHVDSQGNLGVPPQWQCGRSCSREPQAEGNHRAERLPGSTRSLGVRRAVMMRRAKAEDVFAGGADQFNVVRPSKAPLCSRGRCSIAREHGRSEVRSVLVCSRPCSLRNAACGCGCVKALVSRAWRVERALTEALPRLPWCRQHPSVSRTPHPSRNSWFCRDRCKVTSIFTATHAAPIS